jgi:hypothetical protein
VVAEERAQGSIVSIDQQTRPPNEIEIRYATTGDADGIAALFDRVYHGGYHLAECTDPDLVRRTVASPGHLWVLALDAGTVVGSFAARLDPGTARYEVCRAAIDAAYRGRADVGAAAKVLGRDTIRRPDCELLYVKARSEISRRKCARELPGCCWTGSDGGMHVLIGEREELLFGMAFNPGRTVTRVVPHRPVVLPGSPVAREVGRLRSATRTGDYPALICAPGASQYAHESSRGRVSYSVLESSRSAVVSAVAGDTPGDVGRVLWEILDGAGPSKIEHLTLYALADKLPVIEELCRPGDEDPGRRFAVRGYLPGWHKDGAARYDCVTLTARRSEQVLRRHGLDTWIERIYRSFPPGLR